MDNDDDDDYCNDDDDDDYCNDDDGENDKCPFSPMRPSCNYCR